MGRTSRSLSIRCSASVKRSAIVCIGPPVLRRGQSVLLYPLQGPSPAPSGQPATVVVGAAPAERLGEQHGAPWTDDPDRPEGVELTGADHGGDPDGEHDDGGHGPVAPGRLTRGPAPPAARRDTVAGAGRGRSGRRRLRGRTRQVGGQLVELAVGPGGVGAGQALVVLGDGEPPGAHLLTELGGDGGAVGVSSAQVRLGHGGGLLGSGSQSVAGAASAVLTDVTGSTWNASVRSDGARATGRSLPSAPTRTTPTTRCSTSG